MRKVLSFIITFITFASYGQHMEQLDSLKKNIDFATNDSIKVEAIIAVSVAFSHTIPDSGFSYAQKALTLARNIKHKQLEASALNQFGNLNRNKGNYSESLNYFIKSLKIAEEMGDLNRIARINNNIGIIYYYQKNFKETLIYFEKTVNTLLELGDKSGSAAGLNNMGGVYTSLGQLEKALEYFNRAYELALEMKDKEGQAIYLTGIGTTHMALGNSKLALNELKKALAIKREGNNLQSILHSLIAVGQVYLQMDQLDSSMVYFSQLHILARKNGFPEMIKTSYQKLSIIYETKGDNEQALKYHRKYSAISDSIMGDESAHELAQIKIQYEDEKKKKEIELLKTNEILSQQKLSNQKWQLIALIGGVIALIGFSLFIYYRLIDTRKKNLIIKSQKELVDEKNKDIQSSIEYALRIQNSLLTTNDYISKAFKDYFIFYLPKDVVSGDFYWIFQKDDLVVWCIVDCTGHGVPGAFMSIIGNSAFNEIVIENGIFDPDIILNRLHEKVLNTLGRTGGDDTTQDGMDVSICTWNKKTGKIQFSGAMNSVYIARKIDLSNLEELKANRMSVGDKHNTTLFTKVESTVNEGDMLYMFSDGYADQFGGEDNKKFMQGNLKKLLLSIASKSTQDQKENIVEGFNTWKKDVEQIDDISVMGVRF